MTLTLVPAPIGTLMLEQAGGTSTVTSLRTVTQAGHGFAVQNVVRIGGGGAYVLAQADNATNAEVVGVVAEVVDADTFRVVSAGWVGGLSGLTPGALYYLSASAAGSMTAAEPQTPGQVSKPLFVADTATSGYWVNYRGRVIM